MTLTLFLQIVGLSVAGTVVLAGLASIIGTLLSTPDDWEYEDVDHLDEGVER